MSDLSDQELELELAMHMPAQGESFWDWAKNNPEDEYALWMTIRHPEEKIEHEMEKRVRSAERAPKWAIAHAAAAASIGLYLDGAIIEQTARDGRIGNLLVIGVISLYPFKVAKDIIKHRLPQAKAYARQERELFERGMSARTEAKMILAAENN